MNGFWRSGLVLSALATLLTTIITRYQAMLSDAVLSWVLIGGGSALTSIICSWVLTQAYKFFCINVDLNTPPSNTSLVSLADIQAARDKWLEDVRQAKRHIYACAMATCFVPALALGTVLFLVSVTREARVVYGIAWTVGSITLSGASPWLWKVVFQQVVPWMLAQEKRGPQA